MIGSLLVPVPAIGRGPQVLRLLNFWQVWTSYGSTPALIASGCWSRSSVYRQVAEFREVFGCSVAEFRPWSAGGRRAAS